MTVHMNQEDLLISCADDSFCQITLFRKERKIADINNQEVDFLVGIAQNFPMHTWGVIFVSKV